MTAVSHDSRTIQFLGNNQITVLVSGEESGGAFSLMELVVQPHGGANALHTDHWVEVFHVIEGEAEWTLERNDRLETWTARAGDTIVVPAGARHKFAGAGDRPCRLLTMSTPEYEQFFRALADAWQGPFDRERTPQAVGPVFQRFGMQLCSA